MNGKITSAARNKNARTAIYESGFQGGENVSPTPVAVLGIVATNKGAATTYVMLFDSAAAPSGAPTYAPVAVPAGQTVAVSYNDVTGDGSVFGLATSSGLSWGASSSASTYTADASDVWCSIRFMQ